MGGHRGSVLLVAAVMVLAAGCATPARPAADQSGLGAARVLRDLVFADRETGRLRLDLYVPRTDRPHPLVVYVHGGGWEAGSRRIDAGPPVGAVQRAARSLLEHGYALATVDYRLAGRARFPAQVVDVAAAVRWLRAHADRWEVDTDRLVLWGGSAGGHLVSLVAALAGEPSRAGGGVRGVRAVVNWAGPTDITARAPLARPAVDEYARRAVGELLGCMPVRCPRRAATASPIRAISGDEAPFLLQHGMEDRLVPVRQSLDFAARLRELRVPVEMHPYAGVGHVFSGVEQTPMIVRTMVEFVEQHVPAS